MSYFRIVICSLAMSLSMLVSNSFAENAKSDSNSNGAAGSNPLASVSKIDLEWQYTKSGGKNVNDIAAKASTMLHERIKLNLELHYIETDVTGQSESDFGTASIKPIFFLKDAELSENWGVRLATGFEWFVDFDNQEKGIGNGSHALGPLLGTAFLNKQSKTVLIPLVQHNESYQNGSLSQTVFRIIGLQPLPGGYWLKLDAKIPYDWEDHTTPINSEFEAGKMITSSMGVYLKALVGVGEDRPFDSGVTGAMRLNF